ncbi:hypothetical protein HPB50_022232 [Hyalomma asiaticum]|uniref:Uncharacterized protein n=1 Tax=Hyalomma asiaticum TaxID=266040 RepID=A0ACB7SHZ1_HYAAI|nr:hypothetical protein HPB50_022232 [Hyalomma asiaticum]
MFAVVRFLDDFDGKRHVIPASDKKNFYPENDLDFDKYATYSAYWRDPVDDEDTGFYNVQILMLAESEAGAQERMDTRRVPVPKIRRNENTSSDGEEPTLKKKKAEKKKEKQNKESAQHSMYEQILGSTLRNAHAGVKQAQRRTETGKAPNHKRVSWPES